MDLDQLSEQIGQALLAQKLVLATAESCTGGWVAQVVTQTAGSSQWFDRGFVTYTNESKQEMLAVREATLQQHGAVSQATVTEMAEGALKHSHAQIALSISGIAGPSGGTADKPIGLVWFAWAQTDAATQTQSQHFSGDRTQVRYAAVEFSLQRLLQLLTQA
ncbi:nicotinamide-nucleotide amidase [Kaarinaea lacus]